jgi:hypothetical protein
MNLVEKTALGGVQKAAEFAIKHNGTINWLAIGATAGAFLFPPLWAVAAPLDIHAVATDVGITKRVEDWAIRKQGELDMRAAHDGSHGTIFQA